MIYKNGYDPNQIEMMCLESEVPMDSPARVISAFVEEVVKGKVSFTKSDRKNFGRPSFDPLSMMKLYLYGYYSGIRSSRKLARQCHINIEVWWLMGRLRPDFRTIADFRKNNIDEIGKVFDLFVDYCSNELSDATGRRLFDGFKSVDGTKIRAVQAKDGCYTASKVDDRIKNDRNRIAEIESYLDDMDKNDAAESADFSSKDISATREEKEKSLAKYKERLEKHEAIRDKIEGGEVQQYAENDGDSRLMKNHYGGFNPSFNMQTAVDSDSHMVAAVEVGNQCTDHGLLFSTMGSINPDGKVISLVADNGYDNKEDMQECLEHGIIPNVCLSKESDGKGNMVRKKDCKVSFMHEDADISEEEKSSTDSSDIRKCLRTGVVPDCYKDILVPIVGDDGKPVIERGYHYETVGTDDPMCIDSMTDDEMVELARRGYFVRDIRHDKVICPAGQILRRKSEKKSGVVRYCNKLACSNCMFRGQCYSTTKTTKWKEIDFSKGARTRKAKFIGNRGDETIGETGKGKKDTRRVCDPPKVSFIFKPDVEKLEKRKCLSEHPFGTIKRYMDGDHFLLKGLRKVGAEAKLLALGYNFRRLIAIFGSRELARIMAE